jgi:hypothetical protein
VASLNLSQLHATYKGLNCSNLESNWISILLFKGNFPTTFIGFLGSLPPPNTYAAPTLQIEECLESDTSWYPTLTHIALNHFHFLKLSCVCASAESNLRSCSDFLLSSTYMICRQKKTVTQYLLV